MQERKAKSPQHDHRHDATHGIDDQNEEPQKKNQPKSTRKAAVLKGTGKQNIGKFSAADKKAWLYIGDVNKEVNENAIKIVTVITVPMPFLCCGRRAFTIVVKTA